MPRLTSKQIKNQILWNRFKRKWSKRLTPDAILVPFIGGLLIMLLVVLMAMKTNGVI